MNSIQTGAVIAAILALSIPIISGLTQYISMKLMPTATPTDNESSDNTMANSMNATMKIMPLFSVVMCFTFPSGIGLYWVAQSVFTIIQQVGINFLSE